LDLTKLIISIEWSYSKWNFRTNTAKLDLYGNAHKVRIN